MSARAKTCLRRAALLAAACALLQSVALGLQHLPVVGQISSSGSGQVSDLAARVRQSLPSEALLTEALEVGNALLRAGRYSEAGDLFAALLEKWPSDSRVLYGSALSTFNLGRSSEAEPLARRAAEISLTQAQESDEQTGVAARLRAADAFVLWAVILGVRGNDAKALEAAKRAAELAPRHFDAQFTYGRALYSSGNYDAAAKSFSNAVSINANDAKALFFLATAQERAGQTDAALASYRALVASKPEDANGHLGLGVLLVKKGNRAEGIASLTRALALNPRSYEANVTLGRTLVAAGRPAEALELLIRAAELAPGNPEPHYQLSLAYRRLGRREQAAAAAAIVKEIHEARRLGRNRSNVTRLPDQ